uniref:Uncharacterized protein n=1 Tax=Meloidogyne enterolobii TaxID=390850 RepID=A0A6V7V3X1_MELEN|nr:unnamed protein product [Meloidogyne enterolobii]
MSNKLIKKLIILIVLFCLNLKINGGNPSLEECNKVMKKGSRIYGSRDCKCFKDVFECIFKLYINYTCDHHSDPNHKYFGNNSCEYTYSTCATFIKEKKNKCLIGMCDCYMPMIDCFSKNQCTPVSNKSLAMPIRKLRSTDNDLTFDGVVNGFLPEDIKN